MLYLLDADTVIRGDREFYPLRRFGVFWRWLCHLGDAGQIKIPLEQFEEIVAGTGEIVDWLNEPDVKKALVLAEEAQPDRVSTVLEIGYGGNLNEDQLELVGRDPFLISYCLTDLHNRKIVTFEVSAPGQRRGKRKLPDACMPFGIECCNLYGLIRELDFTTDWRA